jgi:hypothetical protein
MTTSRGNIPADTVFLLSPARCGGERAEMLARSKSPLGVQLRAGSAPLGDVFAWLSALYFRGKLAYASRFSTAVYVMTPGAGLLPPNTMIGARDLQAMGKVDIESPKFTKPLRRDAERLDRGGNAVILGSIATGKYVDTLLAVYAWFHATAATCTPSGNSASPVMITRFFTEPSHIGSGAIAFAAATSESTTSGHGVEQ